MTIITVLCTHWLQALPADTERVREVTIITVPCTHWLQAMPADTERAAVPPDSS